MNTSVSIAVSASFCQVYPLEYAYHQDSVYRTESTSANCRNYPVTPQLGTEDYIHCDGTPLRLTDSDFGTEQYTSSDYYVWTGGSSTQLLFIFPTRVNLTTITLHYYSGSVRGLPRLRFYAVPDDFDIWDASTASYSHADVTAVPAGEDPAGHRNVNLNFKSTTMKILLNMFASNFNFAVSEVEFFNNSFCSLKLSSLTRDPKTASQYQLHVTEIASMISRTLSKLLVGRKTKNIIMYVSLCCSSSVKLPFAQVIHIIELLSMYYTIQT